MSYHANQIRRQFFALSSSALKMPTWNLDFVHFFELLPSSRYEDHCDKLKVFVLFQDSRNLPWPNFSADPILDMEYKIEDAVAENVFNKAQKQERIAEEIKTVLKPHYTSKRIGKEDYKNILRKCVPKLSRSVDKDDETINFTKIQKLVEGYVRKYQHARKYHITI